MNFKGISSCVNLKRFSSLVGRNTRTCFWSQSAKNSWSSLGRTYTILFFWGSKQIKIIINDISNRIIAKYWIRFSFPIVSTAATENEIIIDLFVSVPNTASIRSYLSLWQYLGCFTIVLKSSQVKKDWPDVISISYSVDIRKRVSVVSYLAHK